MRKNKIISTIFLLIAILFIPKIVKAADATLVASKTTVEVGESVSITSSISATEAWNLKITALGGNLSGTTESTDASDGETSRKVIDATFSASSQGTYTISLSGQITGSDLNKETINKSVTITVNEKKEETKPEPVPEPIPEPTPDPGDNSNNESKPTSSLTAISIDGTNYKNGATVPAVENSKNSIRVTAVGTSNYSIKVNGNSVYGTTVNLEEGTNEIVVTNLDNGESIKVYISRKAKENTTPNVIEEEPEEEPKEELRLANLEIKDFTLTPVFSKDTYSYVINIDKDKQQISTLDISAVANDENAKVTIQGNDNFKDGENIIYIILESEDGQKVTYQIVVNITSSSSEIIGERAETSQVQEVESKGPNVLERMTFIIVIASTILVGAIIITTTLIVANNKKIKEEEQGKNIDNKNVSGNDKEVRSEEKVENKKDDSKHKGKRFK